MKDEQFRQWLRDRGGNPNSVTTRVTAVRKVEKELSALESPHTDLDAAYDEDAFAQIKRILDELRRDARAGGERYRILFPNSKDPLNRIANTRAWLGQYAQFRSNSDDIMGVDLDTSHTYWFVGASFGREDDQVQRFVEEGIWEIRTPGESDAALVRSMRAGDRIAIKASFVQRRNLPFDNRDHNVSVMRLKARGIITANPEDGERVSVAWDEEFEARDWYFYTYRPTIWKVKAENALADRLIAFAFYDEPQDLNWFRNHSTWASTLGDNATPIGRRFWVEKTIVHGRADREKGEHALGKALWSPQRSKDGRNIYANMLHVRPEDIIFHLTDNNAISNVSVAASVADQSFIGLPDTEWAGQPAYRVALKDNRVLEPPLPRQAFLETEPFDRELSELADAGAKGLFYNSKRGLNQGAYLTEITPTLLSILSRAYEAFAGKGLPHVPAQAAEEAEERSLSYSLDDALETLFLDRGQAEDILQLWKAKKNIILQGPPGVGKSFAAHKLAYALMGAEDRSRVGFVQFHQSYSYEDFVEGFRPTVTGFELRPGKFVEFCRRAEADPNNGYVFIIDEINRGNLSKILGELMVLIETDKRNPEWAMALASGKAPFHVPANVYILGLMNTADRSLAVVDYALRRRFGFIDLRPQIASDQFRKFLKALNIGPGVGDNLIERIGLLNDEISGDVINLGPGFAIGHSFFCTSLAEGETDEHWYVRVIKTEILPLLREYWFDAPAKAATWEERLLSSR